MPNSHDMRRLPLLLASLATAAALTPHAAAADPVPAPTVRVKVTAAGVSLPKSTLSATWTVGQSGIAANFNVDAKSAPGTLSTVEAVWTTKDFRFYGKDIRTMEFLLDAKHQSPAPNAGWTIETRYRQAGGRTWSGWQGDSFHYEALVTDLRTGADRYLMSWNPNKQVQYQVRIRVDLADGGTEVEHWRLRANT